MRWLPLLLVCSTLGAADLSSVGPVYFWPMQSALDQYIAERATAEGLFTVTVDPAAAKSVMTDRVDSKFFEGMQEVFVEEKPADATVDATAETEAKPEPTMKGPIGGSVETGLELKRAANRPQGTPKGTVFLVDVKSRQVLWSTYLGDFQRRPEKLHKEATQVVERIRKSMAAGQ